MLIFNRVLVLTIFIQFLYSQEFSVSINVSGGTSDYDLTVGFSPSASDGYDSEFDYFAPPAPPPPSFDAALIWDGDRYYTQILSGDSELSSHELTVQLQYPEDNSIHFSWDNSGWSDLGSFELTDPFGGLFVSVDMNTQNELFITNPAITSVVFVVTPSADETTQNPFEGQISPTPMSGIFQGQITANELSGSASDWIAAFDSEGNIAGATSLILEGENSYANLTIYGDDPLTEYDEGINEGESFHLKLWLAEENIVLEYYESFECWYNNNGAPMVGCGDYTNIYNFGDEFEPPPIAELVINEIHYNPSSDLQGSDEMYEFLEIYNLGSETVNLSGYKIMLGIDAEFPEGSQISGGEYVIVAKTPDTYIGNGYQVFSYTGYIYNAGEELELVDSFGRSVDYVQYDDEGEWPTGPDGGGASLELFSPSLDNELPSSWAASLEIGGTPGLENSIAPEDENIVVTVGIVEAYEGYTVSVPVEIHFPDDLSALSADLSINGFTEYADLIEINMDGSLPLSANWNVASNEVDGSLLIAMAGASSISGDGLLFTLVLSLYDEIDMDFLPINISSAVFNTEDVPELENGGVEILEPVPPTASFSAYPTEGLFPLNISFINTSEMGTGTVTEYHWDFGNGDISDDESPQYTYELPGVYQATLTVATNHGEGISEPMEITVLALYGDVDLNDMVQSFDASLILQYLVGGIELTPLQSVVGDVNISSELSSLDASYILQYLVGLIGSLPVEDDAVAGGELDIESQFGAPGEIVTMPLQVTNGENILSFESLISFDNSHLTFEGIVENSDHDYSIEVFEENGSIKLAGASHSNSTAEEGELISLKFSINDYTGEPVPVVVEQLKWNENETITSAAEGHINIMASDVHTLSSGWNLMSFDVNMMSDEPEFVFDEIISENNLISVSGYEEEGSNFYDPFGPVFLNTLESIDVGRGYWVKLIENDQLTELGMPLENYFSVSLWEGWNIIGYWLTEGSAPEEAFSDLIGSGNLIYATGYNESGFSFYDPNGLEIFNTLTSLENGFGYMVKLNQAVEEFQYPAPSGAMAREVARNINSEIVKTNGCMFINGTVTFQNIEIAPEEKVNVYTESGLLVGEMEILEQNYLLTGAVYSDDSSTEIVDGARENDRLIFRYGDYKSEPIQVTYSGDMSLQKVELRFSGIPSEFAVIGNFPNPFNPTTTIKYGLPREASVTITITNILGEEVRSLVSTHQTAGYHSVLWNGKDNQNQSVSAGVYLYHIEAGEVVQTRKMVLLK